MFRNLYAEEARTIRPNITMGKMLGIVLYLRKKERVYKSPKPKNYRNFFALLVSV